MILIKYTQYLVSMLYNFSFKKDNIMKKENVDTITYTKNHGVKLNLREVGCIAQQIVIMIKASRRSS